jgi:hypothetical protein
MNAAVQASLFFCRANVGEGAIKAAPTSNNAITFEIRALDITAASLARFKRVTLRYATSDSAL